MKNSALNKKVLVVKIGTSSIVDQDTLLPRFEVLKDIIQDLAVLQKSYCCILVSSGAVGIGRCETRLSKPVNVAKHHRQALAAIGQSKLNAMYDQLFQQHDLSPAQILLLRENLEVREQFNNVRATILELLKIGAIPIINENDCVSLGIDRIGDNDTLAAIIAGMVGADTLVLLTDVDALYTNNPNTDPDAIRIAVVDDVASIRVLADVSSLGSDMGTGGMETKLIAAEIATASGCRMIIASSNSSSSLTDLVGGNSSTGTIFTASKAAVDCTTPYDTWLN